MGLLAARYARALFDYAEDMQQTASLTVEMGRIPESFLLYPDLQTVIDNPVVDPEEKCKLILTAAQADKNSLLNQFLIFLIEKKRLTYINRIALQYIQIHHKAFNIHNMTITTAFDADKETIGQLQNWIQKELKGSVQVKHQKDESIIGGFIADVDFNRWDASVRMQLSEIKKKLS